MAPRRHLPDLVANAEPTVPHGVVDSGSGVQCRLSASDAHLQLTVGGYAFTDAARLITGGRLGDIVGRRRMHMVGLAATAVVPQVLALITASFP